MTMARNGCLCRVPLEDARIPTFYRTAELLEWCADHGVDLAPDHQGRLSVDMETAYRLFAESEEASRKAAEEQAAKAAKLAKQISEAYGKRQRVYIEAYTKYMQQGLQPSRAMEHARAAVEHAERNLDPVIKAQVPSHIEIPQVYPPNVGRVTGQAEYDPDDSWRAVS